MPRECAATPYRQRAGHVLGVPTATIFNLSQIVAQLASAGLVHEVVHPEVAAGAGPVTGLATEVAVAHKRLSNKVQRGKGQNQIK